MSVRLQRPVIRVSISLTLSYKSISLKFQQDQLLKDRQTEFNRQLDVLAEPLGALYERTAAQYTGTPFTSNSSNETSKN